MRHRGNPGELARRQLPAKRRGLRLALIVRLLWDREHHVMDDQTARICRLQYAQLTAITARHAYVACVP
jgi:hypothetical protein